MRWFCQRREWVLKGPRESEVEQRGSSWPWSSAALTREVPKVSSFSPNGTRTWNTVPTILLATTKHLPGNNLREEVLIRLTGHPGGEATEAESRHSGSHRVHSEDPWYSACFRIQSTGWRCYLTVAPPTSVKPFWRNRLPF